MSNKYVDYKAFNNALDRLMQGKNDGFSEQAVTAAAEISYESKCDGGMGKLVVQVTTASGTLPISGAKITVSDASGDVISEQYTDNSGRTKSIELCAPLAANSQAPGGLLTYSTYNVKVEKEGYFTEEFLNVAVFDKIESIQPAALEPLGENSFEDDRLAENERTLTGQNINIPNVDKGARTGDMLIIEENPNPAVDEISNGQE